jgi:hypothetical protein
MPGVCLTSLTLQGYSYLFSFLLYSYKCIGRNLKRVNFSIIHKKEIKGGSVFYVLGFENIFGRCFGALVTVKVVDYIHSLTVLYIH